MGHSKTRMNLAHKLKSKRSARIGVLILIGGILAFLPCQVLTTAAWLL